MCGAAGYSIGYSERPEPSPSMNLHLVADESCWDAYCRGSRMASRSSGRYRKLTETVMAKEKPGPTTAYSDGSLRVLLNLGQIRQYPGMYIGNVRVQGLCRMVYQLVRNSLNEATKGYGHHVHLKLHTNGSIELTDDGRTPPIASSNPDYPALEAAFATLGTAYSPDYYSPPGSSRVWFDFVVANALSEWLWVEALHKREIYRQDFRHGEPQSPPLKIDRFRSPGLIVAFKPDSAIFGDNRLSAADIREWLRCSAFLNSGVRLTLSDLATETEERFEFKDGIRAYVELLDSERHPLHPDVFVVRGEEDGVMFEVGLRWSLEDDERGPAYANGHLTPLGGTHVTGLRTAITRSLNSFIREHFQGFRALKGDEARAGLTSVVSVRLNHALYEGATHSRLSNDEVRRVIETGVRKGLRDYLLANSNIAERVVRVAMARPTGPPMTDAEWCCCIDPRQMLRLVNRWGSRRRATLFVLACCRLNPRTNGNLHHRKKLLDLERSVDGSTEDYWTSLVKEKSQLMRNMVAAVTASDFSPLDAARLVYQLSNGSKEERKKQASLVGHILEPIPPHHAGSLLAHIQRPRPRQRHLRRESL